MNKQLIYKNNVCFLINRETSLAYIHLNKKSISFWFSKYIRRSIIIIQVKLYLKCSILIESVEWFPRMALLREVRHVCVLLMPVKAGTSGGTRQSTCVGETDVWLIVFFRTVLLALQLRLLFADPGTIYAPDSCRLQSPRSQSPSTDCQTPGWAVCRYSFLLHSQPPWHWSSASVWLQTNAILWSWVAPLQLVTQYLPGYLVFLCPHIWLAHALTALDFILNTE